MRGYRLLRDGKTIVHGVNGSRTLPVGVWIEADVKWACNPGSKDQPHYWTGFHVFADYETAVEYQKKFKRPPEIVEVEYEDWWEKPTNRDVRLARWIRIPAL